MHGADVYEPAVPSQPRPWTASEDDALASAVRIHGSQWSQIAAQAMHGRTGKQCRERWHNQTP